MAEKLICPKCKRPSYTTAPYEPSPCPYCGFIFCKAVEKDTGDDENPSTQ
ncbi:MAG: hypothetical protein HY026_09310 [Deltaproteobacteria bacterium]|nr:hypothetical protein [Deltaproteobacteria bacterium]